MFSPLVRRLVAAPLLALCAGSAAALAAETPGGAGRLGDAAAPVRYDLTIAPDAGALTFKGEVRIAVRVRRAVDRLTLNAAELKIDRATLDGRPARIALDADAETASFATGAAIAPGPHVLSLAYSGAINRAPSGLFAIDYGQGAGRGRVLATQFEPADARRLLPAFDEPGYKAVFALTVLAPRGQTVVANMPEASRAPAGGGLERVVFRPTPPMSVYLLFFGLGDLERSTRVVDGVTLSVVTRRGGGAQAAFALDSAAELLPFYRAYFGTPYSLPKLDLVAAPGDVAGSMENWGAVLFSQTDVLTDPRLSSASERERVFSTVAHEMAHQWFGDLVTPAWWSDLWLNEGFATWMTDKAEARFHPEWRPRLAELADKDEALRLDALASAQPIVRDIKTSAQAEQAFDSVTYLKGAEVLRMLEAYAGEDAFRDGVRAYLHAHAFGSATTADLWTALDAASGGRLSATARDFTEHPGAPLVSLGGCEPLTLSQAPLYPTSAGATWRTPVTVAAPWWNVAPSVTLVNGAAPATAPILILLRAGCLDAIVNAGQTGYFRTSYDKFGLLLNRFASLSPEDQLGTIIDAQSLGFSGQAPITRVLDAVQALPPGADLGVWRYTIDRLTALDELYPDGSPGEEAYTVWARGRLAPVLARVGLTPRANEDALAGFVRERLVTGLGQLDDPAVIAWARGRFAAFEAAPGSLPADLRRPVIRAVARHADAATWERLHALARAATDPLEREQLYEALAAPLDPALSQRALELAIGPEPPAHLGPAMILAVAPIHPDLAWRFALAHLPQIEPQLDALARTTFMASVAAESADPARAAELTAYAAVHLPPSASGAVARARDEIAAAAAARKRLPDINAWIARFEITGHG